MNPVQFPTLRGGGVGVQGPSTQYEPNFLTQFLLEHHRGHSLTGKSNKKIWAMWIIQRWSSTEIAAQNVVSQVAFLPFWRKKVGADVLNFAHCNLRDCNKGGNRFSSRLYVDHLSKAWQQWFIKFWIMTAICQWTVILHAFDWNYYSAYKWPAVSVSLKAFQVIIFGENWTV